MDPEFMGLLQQNIFRAGVVTNPYEYLPVAETPVPKGYKPFYISHHGRPFSRHWKFLAAEFKQKKD